jgi:hypothetical protein
MTFLGFLDHFGPLGGLTDYFSQENIIGLRCSFGGPLRPGILSDSGEKRRLHPVTWQTSSTENSIFAPALS